MFKAVWKFGKADFDDVKSIRTEVFVDEQGGDPEKEFDDYDVYAAHLLVTADTGELIATARIYPLGHDTGIGRIAVRKKFRSEGYYDLALRMLLYKGQGLSGHKIVTDAPADMRSYYESFGFTADGGEFEAHGGKYVHMSVDKNGVRWFSQCGHMEKPE